MCCIPPPEVFGGPLAHTRNGEAYVVHVKKFDKLDQRVALQLLNLPTSCIKSSQELSRCLVGFINTVALIHSGPF